MFSTQKKSGEATLVLDIGSGSVGAAVVCAQKNAAPNVIFSTRLPAALQNEPERSRSVSNTIQALELIMKAVVSQHIAIHKTHIFFAPEWCLSQTSILKVDHATPTVLTRHTIDQFIKATEKKFIEDSHSIGEVVEHRIIRVKLNGYEVADPYDKKAKNAEITFFAGIVAQDVLESVRRVIEKHFHLPSKEISSFCLAAFSVLRSVMPDEKDFLMVNVQSNSTSLSAVTSGVLTKNLSFPQGKNTLVNAVSVGSGQSPIAALSFINTTFQDNCETVASSGSMRSAETFQQTWSEAYKKALADVLTGAPLPRTIFLIADPDVELFFEKILSEIKSDGNIHLLKHLNMRKFIQECSVSTDEFLALESIFVTMI